LRQHIITQNKFNPDDKNDFTILDKLDNSTNKIDEYKTFSNYNKSCIRTGYNSNYNESERMFHILPKYKDTKEEKNIMEEYLNKHAVNSLEKTISKTSNEDVTVKFTSTNKTTSKIGNRKTKRKFNLKTNDNNDINNKIETLDEINSDKKIINNESNKPQNLNTLKDAKEEKKNIYTPHKRNIRSSPQKELYIGNTNYSSKNKTCFSGRSKKLNSDLNVSGYKISYYGQNSKNENIEETNNKNISGILPLIEGNNNENNEKNTLQKNEEKLNDMITNNKIKSFNANVNNKGKKYKNIENNNSFNDKEVRSVLLEQDENNSNYSGFGKNIERNKINKNNDNSLNEFKVHKSNNNIKFHSNKKPDKQIKNNVKTNNKSFESNRSNQDNDNSCLRRKKSFERIFPNIPTFYGFTDLKQTNNKTKNIFNNNNNNSIEEEKKLNYVYAAKTTLNYLSNALKTNVFTDLKKKYNFDLNSSNARVNLSSYKLSPKKKDIFCKEKITKANKESSITSYNNYSNNVIGSNITCKNQTITKLENFKKHLKNIYKKDILVNELNDDSINENVEIFKNILNSRDYIPQSNFDVVGTPRGLKPTNFNNYKNKIKKFCSDDIYNNFGNKKFDAERFMVRNGFSFSPLVSKPIRFKDKKI